MVGSLPVSVGEAWPGRRLHLPRHSSATDALQALPCSLFFSLKTHSALPHSGQTAQGLPQYLRDPASGRAPHPSPLRPLHL